MNAMLKRFISLMLCFIMVAGYLPVGALAEETGTVQEPSDDTAVVVEEESADADEKVLVESEWTLPDCDCGSTETELGKHGETCARKVFLEEFCEETAADIFAKWEKLPEECQKYILEYLSRDEADAEKLAELKGYVDAARTEPTEEAAEESVEETGAPAEPLMTLATGDSVTVIAGSDFQYNVNNVRDHNQGANLVTTFLNKIKESHTYVNGFLFCGDYDYGYNDSANGKAALQTAVLNVYGNNGLTADKMIWVQGNHDADSLIGNVLSSSGAHDASAYGVYVINEKDYMWHNDDETTIKNTAAALKTYLDAKVAAKYSKPIFVLSHLPLHYCMRTNLDGDGKYANYIFDVLNEAGADGLNIIFLYGHDHSNGWDDYLGGSAVYLAKGDSINIAQSSKKNFATKKLNFTYMNAGYVAYYSTPTSGAETDLSMTVFQITDDTVTVTRYIAGGSHDLKSAGVKNTTKGDTFEPDTRVISSPQTITLNKTFKATATSAETGVSVSGMGITGMTVEKVEQDVPTGYSAYATYDITPTGFAGGTATVTIEVDDSFDASRPVTVIDVKTGDTQVCQIVDGEVTFTTTHFSLYTVAQTEADSASGEGTLEKYLKQITSVNDLETGVPYIISDYNKEWVLTNITGTTAKNSYPGLVLDGTLSVDTPYLWYINEDGYLVDGSADSAQYLLVGSGVSGSRTTSIGALTESNAGFAATIVTYSGTDFNIKNAGGTGFLNRYGGGPTDNVATSYIDTVGGSGNSYWHIYQLVSDAAVTMTINATSQTITEGGTSNLTPVVTVGGVNTTDYTVTWTSMDESIATVSGSGVVTPKKYGQAYIRATLSSANGVDLASDISVDVLVTVVSVYKTDASVTATTYLGQRLGAQDTPTAGNMYAIRFYSGQQWYLTGTTLLQGDAGYNGLNGIEGLELTSDIPLYDGTWYYDGTYLYSGTSADSSKYLIYDGAKVTVGSNSGSNVPFTVDKRPYDGLWPYIVLSNAIDDGSKRLNQLGGYPYNVVGMYNHSNLMRFYKVLAPAQEVALTVTPNRDTIYPGYTSTLAPTVLIDGAEVSNKTISWTSSNTAVATVSNGVVTAKKGGDVTITATLTAANSTSLGTSVSVEIPIQVIDVTESDGTVTSTVTVEKKMSPVAELAAGTASGPYIITNKGTSVVLTGNMMTKDNPAYNGNGGKVGLELSKYNDFSELWYFDGTYLRYGSANGPYLTLANDQVYLSDSADNAADILTLNKDDGLSYTITSNAVMENSTYKHKYMNHYGGGSYNVVYYWSQDGNTNDGSAWYFNTITPERTATISLTPSPTTVYEGQNTVLTPAITLDGVNQTAYKLKWSSSDETVATVYQGKVTGTAAGNAKIRATVNSINGEKFQTEICVEASVTVIGIAEIKLTDNGSVAQRASAKADTGTKLYIKYTDGTEVYVPITVNMLTDSNGKRVSTYNAGTYSKLTVNYGSCSVDGFTLTVVEPDKPAYPAYPAEGSVFVDKTGTGVDFQSSGVAQIELTAGGIPSKTGADVIIMLDTSSSMRNKVGGSTTITRIQVLTESLNNLLNQLQQKDASGNQMDIRVAVADFNGYYYNYPDSPYYVEATDTTVGNSIRSEQLYQVSSNAIFTGTKDLTAGAFVDVRDIGQNPFTCENYTGKTSGKYTLYTHSGTNYDYAFDAIYQLAEAVNEANSTGEARDLFVIFMSDGAPFQFNYFSSQSNLFGSANWNNWLTGSFTPDMYATNANTTYYHPKGLHWMAEAIKGDPTEDYPVIRKNDERDTDHDNRITLPGLGATMYSIGFCLASDGKITVDAMDTVIRNIASDSKYYFRADTAADLSDAFNLISNEIFYAASEAYFIDEMGEDYDLLLGTHSYQDSSNTSQTVESAIEVRSYSTWTYQDVENKLCDASLVGTRKTDSSGNYVYTLLERVTFNPAGTVAYSNKLSDNILKNGVICANTFWYNTNKYVNETNTGAVAIDTNGDGTTDYTLPAETFYWKLGTVSNAQMTLSYYVYLEDCGVKSDDEPGVPAGIYDTNEHAEMYYVNYLGNDCVQSVETPRLPWQQATVGYGFYLVDSDGNPIVNQSTGEIGSFERAVKITQPVYQEFLLNSDGADIVAEIISGGDVLPEGYKLFDEGAEYEVRLNSNGTGCYIIYTDKVTGKQTTYVVGVTSTPVSNDPSKGYDNIEDEDGRSKGTGQKVDTESYTTANTVVWFGVVATVECVPDTVVIDFGLPVNIDVLSNETMMGTSAELAYIARADLAEIQKGYETAKAEDSALKLWKYLNSLEKTKVPIFNTTSVAGDFGTMALLDNGESGEVCYTLNTQDVYNDNGELVAFNGMQMNKEETFVYAVNYTGSVGIQGYYYSTVTVIPATTIYYEDNFVRYSVFDMDGKKTASEWETVDEQPEDAEQAQDRPGEYSFPDVDANNIYGYDGIYTNMANYSLGSAKKVTANANQFAEAQFTFWGTGFDVVSLTSNTSGTITVSVYRNSEIAANKGDIYTTIPVETHMVDTYYGYQYVLRKVTYEWDVTPEHPNGHWVRISVEDPGEGAKADNTEFPANPQDGTRFTRVEMTWIVDTNASDTLYQVPVMKVSGLDYGQYTALITVWYEESLDHQNDGQYDFYLDAIRIYDPANDGKGNQIIEGAYVADGEGWPEYFELRNLIINRNTFDSLGDDTVNGIVFIDNTQDNATEYSVADYTNFGPNNELYLAPDQAIAFDLAVPGDVAGIHLAMKSVDGTANVQYFTATKSGENVVIADQKTMAVATATDLYYDITSLNNKTVVIRNESGSILSITNVKVTYKSEHTDSIESDYFNTTKEGTKLAVASLMMMRPPVAPEEPDIPETTVPEETVPETTVPETTVPEETEPETTVPEEPEESVFEPGKFSVYLSDSNVKVGSDIVVTVYTSKDVDYITINGIKVTRYSGSRYSSTRTWQVRVEAEAVGDMEIEVMCYNSEDQASEAVVKNVTVTEEYTEVIDIIRDLIIGFIGRFW